LIVLRWAFQWTQTVGWPFWRLPTEVLGVGGLVFLIIKAIGWIAPIAGAEY
jgi:hypothetical protein